MGIRKGTSVCVDKGKKKKMNIKRQKWREKVGVSRVSLLTHILFFSISSSLFLSFVFYKM